MEKTLSELEKLQTLIHLEGEKYRQSIENERPFSEVKAIFLQLKKLQEKADILMQQANKLHENKDNPDTHTPNDSGFMVQ